MFFLFSIFDNTVYIVPLSLVVDVFYVRLKLSEKIVLFNFIDNPWMMESVVISNKNIFFLYRFSTELIAN